MVKYLHNQLKPLFIQPNINYEYIYLIKFHLKQDVENTTQNLSSIKSNFKNMT